MNVSPSMSPNMNVSPSMSPNMNVSPSMSPNMNVSPSMSPKMNTNSNMDMAKNMDVNIHHMKMSERELSLWKVQAYEFAIVEVGLFLDTHPNDQTALSYFKQYRDMKHKAESDFTRKFGPITMDHMDNDLSTWRWIENPWPWETGSEV